MPLLDMLETWFTRRPQRRPLSPSAERVVSFGRWLSPPLPDRDMKATGSYSVSLYLRCALGMVIRLILLYYAFWIILLISVVFRLWHEFPMLFHMGTKQARILHWLWQVLWATSVAKGFILLPFVPLVWALFSLMIWFPRAWFWNRRARRLVAAGEAVSVQEIAEIANPDASVWPPPPRR